MKSTLSILSTAIIVAILSYSNSSLGQDYFHVNGDDISENSASFTDLQVTKDKIPDGSVRFSGVGLSGNKEITFLGQYTNVIISNQETEETAGIVLNNGATAYFNADNTVIDVKSIGSSGKWGFGLLVNGENGSKAVFNGKNVTIKNYQGAYTSQTLTVKEGSSIDFNNSGDIYVSSESPFGVTVVDAQGNLTFNNSGNVTLEGTILPGTHAAQTNVVGIQGSNAQWKVSNNVQDFTINLKGAGVDNDGTSYSTGTVAIQGTITDFTFNGKTLNINMDIAADVDTGNIPEGHTAEKAYGIDFWGGNLETSANSTVNININENLGSAYALSFARAYNSKTDKYEGDGTQAVFNGDVNIVAKGTKESYAIINTDSSVTFNGKNNTFTGDILAKDEDELDYNTEINFNSGTSIINGSTSIEDTATITAENSNLQFNNKLEQKGNGAITLNNSNAHISDKGAAINNLNGKNSTVWLDGLKANSATNLLSIQSNQADNLTIGVNGQVNDQFKDSQETVEAIQNAVAINNSAEKYSYSVKEGMVNNAVEVEVTEDGKILSSVEKTNSVTTSTAELAKLNAVAWRNELNTLTDRMSTLRTAPEFAGTWVRYKGGEWDGDGINQQFNGVELGVDKTIGQNFLVGLSASYINGDGDLDNGSADTDNYSGAAYLSYFNSGWFVDVMGKLGQIETDFDLYNTSGLKDSGDYTIHGYIVGVESGYRFNFSNFYVEPQLQFTYSYLDGKQFSTDNRDIDFNTIESKIIRAGFMSGYDFGDIGSAYLRASYYHDFDGDVDLKINNSTAFSAYSDELNSDWGDVCLGANINLGATTLFVDVARTFGGDIDLEWKANAGARYNF